MGCKLPASLILVRKEKGKFCQKTAKRRGNDNNTIKQESSPSLDHIFGPHACRSMAVSWIIHVLLSGDTCTSFQT